MPSSPLDEHIPDNLAVDGARDAVLQLQVHLGYRVVATEDRGLEDIACFLQLAILCSCHTRERQKLPRKRSISGRKGGEILTSGGGLNHVADGEALDGLVLGGASRAVGAADGLDVAAALLVAAVVLPLLDHFDGILSFPVRTKEY